MYNDESTSVIIRCYCYDNQDQLSDTTSYMTYTDIDIHYKYNSLPILGLCKS